MTDDDVGKVARLKPNPFPGPPGRGRSEPAAPSGDGGKQQVIQVATRCATLDEFVEKFAAALTSAWSASTTKNCACWPLAVCSTTHGAILLSCNGPLPPGAASAG